MKQKLIKYGLRRMVTDNDSSVYPSRDGVQKTF